MEFCSFLFEVVLKVLVEMYLSFVSLQLIVSNFFWREIKIIKKWVTTPLLDAEPGILCEWNEYSFRNCSISIYQD